MCVIALKHCRALHDARGATIGIGAVLRWLEVFHYRSHREVKLQTVERILALALGEVRASPKRRLGCYLHQVLCSVHCLV